MTKIYLHLSASVYIPEDQIHIMASIRGRVPLTEIVAEIVKGAPENYELIVFPAEKARRG